MAVENGPANSRHRVVTGESENIEHVLLANVRAAKSDELIEHGLGIAHSAIRTHRDAVRRKGVQSDPLLLCYMEEVLGDDRSRNPPEIEALAPA